MPFVVDASVAVCWAFADEDHSTATRALERLRSDQARAPSLWWFEVRNALIISKRRSRLTEPDTIAFLRHLTRLGIVIDHSPDESALLGLARQHQLTVYDAAYLELAQREGLALATLDKALEKAARIIQVPLLCEA